MISSSVKVNLNWMLEKKIYLDSHKEKKIKKNKKNNNNA